jgi:hypothetical protein
MAKRRTVVLAQPVLKLKLQRHPNACGATVLAMVTGLGLDEMERINGTGVTPTRQMVAVLRALRLDVPRHELVYVTPTRQPRTGDVVRIKWPSGGHWAAKAEQGFFDPLHGHVTDALYYAAMEKPGVVTSFLPIGWDPLAKEAQ